MRGVGDDESEAVVDAARYVGEGNGAYKHEEVTSGEIRYRYVGQDEGGRFLGDYAVGFTFVGDGSGDYDSRAGDSLFVSRFGNSYVDYVGRGQGRYRPVRRLPLPAVHDLADLALEIRPSSRFRLSSEVAVSRFDRNTFSSIDDGDNSGGAVLVSGSYSTEPILIGGKPVGQLGFESRVRRIGERFAKIDRTDEIEFDRKWNLLPGRSDAETLGEISGSYFFGELVNIRGDMGRLRSGASYESDRGAFSFSERLASLPRVEYSQEQIRGRSLMSRYTSDWVRQRGRAERSLWRFTPSVGFEREDKEDIDSLTTGFQFTEVWGTLAVNNTGTVGALAEYRVRKDREYADQRLLPRSEAATQTYALDIRRWRNLTAAARYVHRTREFKTVFRESLDDIQTDMVDVRANYAPLKRAVHTEVTYRVASEQVAGRERVFLRVAEGEGDYIFDEALNEFIPDRDGDYILRTVPTDDLEPVVNVRASLRQSFDLQLWGVGSWSSDLGKVFANLSSVSYLKVEEKTRDRDIGALYRLDFSRFRQDSATVFGSLTLQQDLYLFEHARANSLRLRYRYLDEKNNQFITGGEKRQAREGSLRWRTKLGPRTSAEIEMGRSTIARLFEEAGRRNRRIISERGAVNMSYWPTSEVELGMKLGLAADVDRMPDPATEAFLRDVELRWSYAWRGRGRFRSSLGVSRVTVEPEGRPISFEMAQGSRQGDSSRWLVGLDYSMSKNVTATISYDGRSEPGRRTIHTGRVEARAYF